MTPLNLAIRCASVYLAEGDVTRLGAVDITLLADALTCGIGDYWSLAPDWVRAPRGGDLLTTTISQATLALPSRVEKFLRDPWARTSSTDAWQSLTEILEPALATATGRPLYYRIADDAEEWDDATGQEAPDPTIILYPTPDAAYQVKVWARFRAPVVRLRHLSGSAHTINLPIPDDHLIRMVVGMCAPHFLKHPRKKATLTAQTARDDMELAERAIRGLPGSRSNASVNVGTPKGF